MYTRGMEIKIQTIMLVPKGSRRRPPVRTQWHVEMIPQYEVYGFHLPDDAFSTEELKQDYFDWIKAMWLQMGYSAVDVKEVTDGS